MDDDFDSTFSSSDEDHSWDSLTSLSNDEDCETRVTFKCVDFEEVEKQMKYLIAHMKEITKMPDKTIALCMRIYDWDQCRLLEHFTEKTPDQFYDHAKVISPFHKKTLKRKRTYDCGICFESISRLNADDIGCGHWFCKECWREYIEQKVISDGVDLIQCPDHKCLTNVDDEFVGKIILKENVIAQHRRAALNSFVKHNKLLSICPAPGCALFISASSTPIFELSCECNCGHKFCFQCTDEPHDPIPCTIMRAWKRNDFRKTVAYLAKKVKHCPKCDISIEKIGGCNIMTCKACRQKFCWLCNKDLFYCDCHVNMDEARLRRFRVFHGKFEVYRNSLLEEHFYRHSALRMQTDACLSISDRDVYNKAIDILFLCHKRLMNSYIFAYYLEKDHQTTIFESNQRDLVEAVDKMENKLKAIMLDLSNMESTLMDMAKYCNVRQKAMQDHISELHTQHGWLLDIDV